MNNVMLAAFRQELEKIAMLKVPGSKSIVATAVDLVPKKVLGVALPIAALGVGGALGGVSAIANPKEPKPQQWNPDTFPVLGEDLR